MPNPEPAPVRCPNCATCPIYQLHTQTPPGTKLRPQRKLDIHTETTIICHYCKGSSSLELAQRYPVTDATIRNILRTFNKQARSLSEAQRNIRKTPLLEFPLTAEILSLLQNPSHKQYLPHLIAVMLLTEGAAGYRQTGHPYITFTNKAETLHAIFADLMYHAYHAPPSAYYRAYWSRAHKQGAKAYYTTYFRRQETETILLDLLKLTPTFRTRPKRGQGWSDYLKEPIQPTLQFLLKDDIPESLAVFALRLAMSAEGAISPMFRTDSNYPYPHLLFSCSHPLLKDEWRRLFEKQGITLKATKAMLESGSLKTAHRFLELGGFFPGVPTRGNSYYHDIDHQDVLKAILIGTKNFPIDPMLALPQKHALLRRKAITIAREENEKRKEAPRASDSENKAPRSSDG